MIGIKINGAKQFVPNKFEELSLYHFCKIVEANTVNQSICALLEIDSDSLDDMPVKEVNNILSVMVDCFDINKINTLLSKQLSTVEVLKYDKTAAELTFANKIDIDSAKTMADTAHEVLKAFISVDSKKVLAVEYWPAYAFFLRKYRIIGKSLIML